MKTKYKRYLKKQNKFNKWELNHLKNLSRKEKLDQFIDLYELKPDSKVIERKHKEHLNNLIEMERKLNLLDSNQ